MRGKIGDGCEELLTGKRERIEEGKAMHHAVLAYSNVVVKGVIAYGEINQEDPLHTTCPVY